MEAIAKRFDEDTVELMKETIRTSAITFFKNIEFGMTEGRMLKEHRRFSEDFQMVFKMDQLYFCYNNFIRNCYPEILRRVSFYFSRIKTVEMRDLRGVVNWNETMKNQLNFNLLFTDGFVTERPLREWNTPENILTTLLMIQMLNLIPTLQEWLELKNSEDESENHIDDYQVDKKILNDMSSELAANLKEPFFFYCLKDAMEYFRHEKNDEELVTNVRNRIEIGVVQNRGYEFLPPLYESLITPSFVGETVGFFTQRYIRLLKTDSSYSLLRWMYSTWCFVFIKNYLVRLRGFKEIVEKQHFLSDPNNPQFILRDGETIVELYFGHVELVSDDTIRDEMMEVRYEFMLKLYDKDFEADQKSDETDSENETDLYCQDKSNYIPRKGYKRAREIIFKTNHRSEDYTDDLLELKGKKRLCKKDFSFIIIPFGGERSHKAKEDCDFFELFPSRDDDDLLNNINNIEDAFNAYIFQEEYQLQTCLQYFFE